MSSSAANLPEFEKRKGVPLVREHRRVVDESDRVMYRPAHVSEVLEPHSSSWCTFLICPLAHGAVVVAGPVVAEEPQREYSVRRTDAPLSIGYDVLVRRDPRRF